MSALGMLGAADLCETLAKLQFALGFSIATFTKEAIMSAAIGRAGFVERS
jgi:hypothetical protein